MLQRNPDPDGKDRPDPYAEHGDGIIDQDAHVQHRRVRLLHRIITESPIPDTVAGWHANAHAQHQGGRDRDLSDVAILVVLLILALEHAALHFTKGASILHHRLLPESRRLLGLEDDSNWQHWYDRLQNGYARLTSLMEPMPSNGHERQTHEAEQERIRKRQNEDAHLTVMRQDRLDWFCNSLLQSSVLVKPELLDGWEGNITIDATAFAVFCKGFRTGVFMPMEPDAGWYLRTAKHEDTDDPSKATKKFYGYEMHIVTPASNSGNSALDTFVKPAIGISMTKPSHDPAHFGLSAIRRAFDTFGDIMRDSIVIADRGYFANSDEKNLQLPVRELGMRFITDYKYDQLGPIGEAGGMIQVEGDLYCPAMPVNQQWATKRARSFGKHLKQWPRIDEMTWLKWIKARAPWRAVQKEHADAKGTIPYRCPAIGPSAKVLCPILRPKDYAVNKDKPGLVKVTASRLPRHPDRICTATSVHVRRNQVAKYRQDMHFASPEWFLLYRSGRNFIEGINAWVKDGTKEAVGNAAKRKARGYSKQYVLVTMLLFASNLRLIEAHLRRPTILPATTTEHARRKLTFGHTYDPATGKGRKPKTQNGYPTNGGFLEDLDSLDEDD
jgi:hypothetical protein